uniref:Coat protein n=2 Tax=Beihai levi-like virus 19 TaxID=1922404 RepID=A0A1L3KI03_9VIRU|nr:hypothetical protein [Beihai levi-like virus 19]
MPALKPITLTDHSSADVIFTPTQIDKNGVAYFRHLQANGKPIGAYTVSSHVKEPGTNGDVFRVKLFVNVPEVATITPNGSDTSSVEIARTNRAQVEFILPAQSAATVREDLVALLASALADTAIKSTIVNVEHFY